MKKKLILAALVLLMAVSSGCGGRSAASRLCTALEDAGFMYEAEFNAAYYGGRFETAEEMYSQMVRDGVSGIIVPVNDELELPGGVECSGFELCGIYFDAGSIFFPSAANISFAEFESTAAAEDYFHRQREGLLAVSVEPTEDQEHRFCATTGDGLTLLSQKGKTVLIFTGESESALAAVEKIGY